MYLIFVKLAFAVYLAMFVFQSLTTQVFEQLLKARSIRYINKQYIQWIINNPSDEWISASYSDKYYKERESESDDPKLDFEICTDESESDEEEKNNEDIELLVGDPMTLVSNDRFSKIIKMVIDENTSTFSTSIKNMFLILAIRCLIGWNCVNEIFVGLFIGVLMHILDLLYHSIINMKQIYFNTNQTLKIDEILSRNNKLSPHMALLTPFLFVCLTTALRASIYTRILGEWVMDLRLVYLYLCIIIGYSLVQNYINILCSCRKNPTMGVLSLVYVIIACLI